MAVNLINLDRVSIMFGTRIILDDVSLGLASAEVVGVVGRNGDGKSTLLSIMAGNLAPDSGQVTHHSQAQIGALSQFDAQVHDVTVREEISHGQPDHVWASDPIKRDIVESMLATIDLDARLTTLSGGERRRVSLVTLLLGDYDVMIFDEPTNHLDVEAVDWLATHLNRLTRSSREVAMVIVSHDRWFLDAVCTRVWEVHDAQVDAYDGGYAAYVLARAERARQAHVTETRRQNLVRKELAWLRRGAPARTSKPKFRIEAANQLIADVPDPRDKLELAKFSSSRLGKDVFDLTKVSIGFEHTQILNSVTWSIGPGDRIGVIGVNGAGKSTLFNLLAGCLTPDSGKIKRGQTLNIGYLSQHVDELDDTDQVLASVQRIASRTTTATGREVSTRNLLEDFGFTGTKLVTRIGELSGGERRRLQFLRLLMSQPNVLLLDEPTNDLDIDTLTVVEDYLDSWPGTMLVASHDRYFLERVCDVIYALTPDGRCVLLPGGVDQYLQIRKDGTDFPGAERRRNQDATPAGPAPTTASAAAEDRERKKTLARLESQIAKLDEKISVLHAEMARHGDDYVKLAELDQQLQSCLALKDQREESWLEVADGFLS